MKKSDFDYGVLVMVLNMANDRYDAYQQHKKIHRHETYHSAQILLHYALRNGFDKTDLITALAPAIEQCRNGLNQYCESYAQELLVACLTCEQE